MREVNTNERDGSNSGRLVLGLLIGAAAGVAVGLLLAPKAGAEFRRQISDTTGRLRRRATDGYVAAADTVSGAVDDVIARGTKAARRGREIAEQIRQPKG